VVWAVRAVRVALVGLVMRVRPGLIRVRVGAVMVVMVVPAARVASAVWVAMPARVASCCCSLLMGITVPVAPVVLVVSPARRATVVLAPREMC